RAIATREKLDDLPPRKAVAAALPVPTVSSAPAESTSAAPAEEPGFLTVDTTPWSLVSENGRVLGQTPLVHVELPSGVHVLSLKNPELCIATRYTVTIVLGKTRVYMT